jgi:hypothetical protein
MTVPARKAILSIHDVWPETLDRVSELLAEIERYQTGGVWLLVSPGKAWKAEDLQRLRDWESRGHQLAAHGWHHRAREVSGPSHRLHSWLISRGLAEHLALAGEEIVALVRRSMDWFLEQGFQPPSLYVPPAWALGKLSPTQRRALPCRFCETLTGMHDLDRERFYRLPLTGFEADTVTRAFFLSMFNRVNTALSNMTGRPVRIAIHPNDLSYHLSGKLHRLLRRPMELCALEQISQGGRMCSE